MIDDIDGYNALLAKLQKAKEVSFAWITQDGEALGVAVCMDLEHVYLIRFMMFITEAMVADESPCVEPGLSGAVSMYAREKAAFIFGFS